MAEVLKAIHKFEKNFDKKAERFAFRHPYLLFFVMFICMPVFILMAVAICTTLIILPIAWIFGWM